jgi:hypothetical protein
MLTNSTVAFVRLNFSPIVSPFADRGLSRRLQMNGEQKSGVSTISLGRLQCVRRDSVDPTDRRIIRRKKVPDTT